MSSENPLKTKIINSKWFQKLKKIKHFDLIVVVIFCSVLLLIYFYDFPVTENNKNSEENSSAFVSYLSYTNDLETRLKNVLMNIKGVGKVSVMITLNGSPELIIAYNTEEKTTGKSTSDTTTIIKEPIIITNNGKSSPIILKEVLPDIKGVIIVAQGADNVSVKLNILDATTKLLGVSANNIEIFAGE